MITPRFRATLTEKVMYQYMLNWLPDLYDNNLDDEFAPIDWYSPSTGWWIEYKQRHRHFVGLTLERKKYNKLIEKEKSFYLNSTPEGIYFWSIQDMDANPIFTIRSMNETTDYGNAVDVDKWQTEMYVGKSWGVEQLIFK
jgi:hypothetical protein